MLRDDDVSLAGNGTGPGKGTGPEGQPTPLDFLAGQVLGAKVNRETVEEELERLARWRFRRRAEVAREVEPSRRREQRLIDLVKDVSSSGSARS